MMSVVGRDVEDRDMVSCLPTFSVGDQPSVHWPVAALARASMVCLSGYCIDPNMVPDLMI